MERRKGKRRKPAAEDDVRGKLIDDIVKKMRKKHGPDSAARLAEVDKLYSNVVDYVSTQCIALDFALHLPGLPVGRIVTIRGAEQSGKTTAAMHALAETQRRGGIGVYIDAEYAFDEPRARALGIDPETLIMVQPETFEDGIRQVDECVDSIIDAADDSDDLPIVTIVFDSLAAAPTAAEMEGEFGDSKAAGSHARVASKAFRRLTRKIAKYKILLIIINQEKENIQFASFGIGGDTKTMTAAKPLGFHSSVILNVKQKKTLKDKNKVPFGILSEYHVRKNKNAAPFSTAQVVIRFDSGFDNVLSLLHIALEIGVLKKSKGFVWFHGEKFRESAFAKFYKDHPEILDEVNAIKNGLAAQDKEAEDKDLPDPDDDDEDEEDSDTDDEDEDEEEEEEDDD